MTKLHIIKAEPENYVSVHTGQRSCTIRKNDRDYKVGDYVLLREWNTKIELFTGAEQLYRITHITEGFEGLVEGYVVLSLREMIERVS